MVLHNELSNTKHSNKRFFFISVDFVYLSVGTICCGIKILTTVEIVAKYETHVLCTEGTIVLHKILSIICLVSERHSKLINYFAFVGLAVFFKYLKIN